MGAMIYKFVGVNADADANDWVTTLTLLDSGEPKTGLNNMLWSRLKMLCMFFCNSAVINLSQKERTKD